MLDRVKISGRADRMGASCQTLGRWCFAAAAIERQMGLQLLTRHLKGGDMNWMLIFACGLLLLCAVIVATPAVYRTLREVVARGESLERPEIPKPRGRRGRMRLSTADQEALARALIDPPEPNAALKRAFKRHNEMLRRSGRSDNHGR